MKGPKPFHTFLGFVDGLQPALRKPEGGLLQRFINQEYLAIAVCQGKFVNLYPVLLFEPGELSGHFSGMNAGKNHPLQRCFHGLGRALGRKAVAFAGKD